MKTKHQFTCTACQGDMCKVVHKPEGMVKECLNCGHEHSMKPKKQSTKNQKLEAFMQDLISK